MNILTPAEIEELLADKHTPEIMDEDAQDRPMIEPISNNWMEDQQ